MVNQPTASTTITAGTSVIPATAGSSNVDFDYSGPPVTVSNEMALDLVKQFGIHNAWLAFLKVRGLRLSSVEATKSKALRRFRARIKKLKSTVETLRDRSDDVSTLMAKEFDTFLEPNSMEPKSGGGAEGAEDGDESEDGNEEGEGSLAIDDDEEEEGADGLTVPTTSSLLQVISKRRSGGGATGAANSSSNNTVSAGPHQPPPVEASTVDTAKEQLAKRHQETIDDVVSSILDKIHNNVPMEGEQAAAAAATAAAAAATAAAAVAAVVPNSVHSPPATVERAKKGAGSRGAARKAAATAAHNNVASANSAVITYPYPLMASTAAPAPTAGKGGKRGGKNSRNGGSTMTVMSSGLVAGYPSPIGISPSGGRGGQHHYPAGTQPQHLPPGTKLAGLVSHHQQQPMSVQPTTTFQLPYGAVPITLAPTAGGAVSGGGHHGAHAGSGGGAITLPSTVTVQALIQSLQQQHPGQAVKHVQFVQAAPPPPHHHHHQQQQQQLGPSPPLPDSSQDAHQRAGQFSNTTTSPTTSSPAATAGKGRGKKGAKAAAANGSPASVLIKSPYRTAVTTYGGAGGQTASSSTSTASKPGSSSDIKPEAVGAGKKAPTKRGSANKGQSSIAKGELEQEGVVGSSGGGGQKHAGGKAADASDAKKSMEQREAERQRIDELEKELSKYQRQLNVERNKNASQKKRLEKTQADLEKSMDAIQLVQIDLACQKTDNNNLNAENIALRAELQQLRSKGAAVATRPPVSIASTSAKGAKKDAVASTSKAPTSGRSVASTAPVGGKRKTNNSSQDVVAKVAGEETESTLLEPMEYGRRQSKRICVARNRFLYNMF